MADRQVTCINKPDRSSSHEHITHIGGVWGRITREDAVRQIDSGTNTYYTSVGGNRATVAVVREAGKQPYLRTHADGKWNDNLLALSECK